MYIFYIIALVPVLVGAYLWFKLKELTFVEWMICVCVAFATAFIFHSVTKLTIQSDFQIVSGNIEKIIYYPEWIEKYEVPIYKTVCRGSGKNISCSSVFSHYESRFRTHHKYWEGYSNIESQQEISRNKFYEIKNKFQNLSTERIYKSGFWSGDPNIYVSYNKSNIVIPVNETRAWDNPVKGKKSLFNFVKIPEEEKKNLYSYPESKDWFISARLIGEAKKRISVYDWDKLNTDLGKTKKANLILIEFPSKYPENVCMYQEALWLGGKKNDVTLCYRMQNNKVISSYVFGWTESELLKRNLETILLESKIDGSLLEKVKSQVESYYVLKDFTKYKYITTNLSDWVLILYILVTCGFQFLAFQTCLTNIYRQS